MVAEVGLLGAARFIVSAIPFLGTGSRFDPGQNADRILSPQQRAERARMFGESVPAEFFGNSGAVPTERPSSPVGETEGSVGIPPGINNIFDFLGIGAAEARAPVARPPVRPRTRTDRETDVDRNDPFQREKVNPVRPDQSQRPFPRERDISPLFEDPLDSELNKIREMMKNFPGEKPGPFKIPPQPSEIGPFREKLPEPRVAPQKAPPGQIGPRVPLREIPLETLPEKRPVPARKPLQGPPQPARGRFRLPSQTQLLVGLITGQLLSSARAVSPANPTRGTFRPPLNVRPPTVPATPLAPNLVRQTQTVRTRTKTKRDRCEKTARKNRKICWRGFYEEQRGAKTKFTKWEAVDCFTGRRIITK